MENPIGDEGLPRGVKCLAVPFYASSIFDSPERYRDKFAYVDRAGIFFRPGSHDHVITRQETELPR